jgi:hypothetical protein
MISEKQLDANRRNALHSTGATSAAGKKRCSLNNLRHGLTGQTTVLSPEERAAHDKFCADLMSCLKPENFLEVQIAQSIAEDHWRLNRVFAIESNIFALGHFELPGPASSEETGGDPEIHDALNTARVFLADARQFALLSIYEQRIHRNLQKSLAQLHELQTVRKQQPGAKLITVDSARDPDTRRPSRAPNPVGVLPNDPARNGFGFANDQIHPAIAAGPAWNPTQLVKISTALAT